MVVRYAHTNLVARDWRRLADFYVEVFGCEPVPPERDAQGQWLDRATDLRGAHLRGLHLRLPGHGDEGPTLEVFSYDDPRAQSEPSANRLGFGHIAFHVDDVAATLDRLLAAGGELGNTVGWFGYGVYSDADLRASTVNISGYPSDKPPGTQWYDSHRVAAVDSRKVFYNIDTMGGQSG